MTSGDHADGLVVGRGRTAFVVPESALSWRFSRSSGPGGQGVNTTDSRVELSIDVAALDVPEPIRERMLRRLRGRLAGTVLTVVAAEHRSQLRNRDAARHRLAALLADAAAPPPPPRRPTKPSKRAKARRLDEKTRRGHVKRLRGRPDDGG
jgi:ribosome-associated protein